MTRVGVRELRQRASELLRLVEQGETVEITDRGRPVAVLAPLPEASPLDRLLATGDLQPASADFDELPPPLRVPEDADSPSSVLARLRRDDR